MKTLIVLCFLLAFTCHAGERSCGRVGDLRTRIRTCAKHEGAKKGNFVLVTRIASVENIDVYLDRVTNLLWTGLNASVLPFHVAKFDLCKSDLLLSGGIDSNWSLPSVAQYRQLVKDGAGNQDFNWWGYSYWTSDDGQVYLTREKKVRRTNESFGYFAQCVASADFIK